LAQTEEYHSRNKPPEASTMVEGDWKSCDEEYDIAKDEKPIF
jgi:hypothetical protein